MTARLPDLIPIGSWNQPVVNAHEWRAPFRDLIQYLAKNCLGVWQSLQAAAERWLEPDPAVELLAHDVAIDARFRAIREICGASRVNESKTADANGQTDGCTH